MKLLLALLAAVAIASPVPDTADGSKHTLERRRNFESTAHPLRVNDGDDQLNCRESTWQGRSLYIFREGDPMFVTCQTYGTVVGDTGNNVWNKIRVYDDRRRIECYVPDFYTLSIEDGVAYREIPGVPAC